jgi:NO-binding membrane sensor protein with MHYT domain
MAIESSALLVNLIPLELDSGAVSAPYSHDRTLVGASLLIAIVTAFAFQELAARARAHKRAVSLAWNIAAGAMFGGSIWLTHLMGMLALETPLVRGLDPAATTVSGIVGLLSGCLAFAIAEARPPWWRLVPAGLIVAAGGIAMHYLGMQGLRIDAALTYRAPLVVATSVAAGIACIAAIWLAYRVDSRWLRVALALPLGAIAAGLHYTDMAALVIAPRPQFEAPALGNPEPWQALGIALATACAVIAALSAAAIDRLAAERNALEAERHVVDIPVPHQNADDVIEVPAPPRGPR